MYVFVIIILFTIPRTSLKKIWLKWLDSKLESFSFESGSTSYFMPHKYTIMKS